MPILPDVKELTPSHILNQKIGEYNLIAKDRAEARKAALDAIVDTISSLDPLTQTTITAWIQEETFGLDFHTTKYHTESLESNPTQRIKNKLNIEKNTNEAEPAYKQPKIS